MNCNAFRHHFDGNEPAYYSIRILLTGLAVADLMAWKPTVIHAIPVVTIPVPAKIHQLTVTR